MSKSDNFFESEEYLNDPIDDDRYLQHYGTPRHSGRYPWGSGKNPQRGKDINARATELSKKGYSEREVASIMGYKTINELRAAKSLGAAARDAAEIGHLQKLYDSGMGYTAIAKKVGLPESSVRSKLNRKKSHSQEVLDNATGILKDYIDKTGEYLDIGKGSELYLNISPDRLKTVTEIMKKQGYEVHTIKAEQLGTGNKTTMKVLAPRGTKWAEIMNNRDKIHAINEVGEYLVDRKGQNEREKLHDPVTIDPKRVYVRYDETGGTEKDGTIELRRGIPELSLGNSRYAQVRIKVGDSGYMKGMAFHSDDIPDGYDIIYNSNRHTDAPLFKDDSGRDSVFKKMKPEGHPKPIDQFGAVIEKQNNWVDEEGNKHEGALNIVREEGSCSDWSRNIASQMLAKQRPEVAKQQLNIDIADRNSEFEEIMSLTNPVVKKRLLLPFSDECDSAATHLKAAAFPRQGWHVILPIPEMKDTEVYAPNYKDGEKVVLVRYPHGGIFEMPELTVNNRVKAAKDILGNAKDAVGINKKIADQLSGADFDGDTVLVIPNNDGRIKSGQPLAGLKGFDTKEAYPPVPDLPPVGKKGNAFDTQKQMGIVSNLIMDMTLGGASEEELVRAVKHSMVVIDAEKHNLNWRQSEIDANLQELKNKYQPKADPTKPGGGASTLISRAKSEQRIPDRKRALTVKDPKTGEYIIKEGIDVKTGEKAWENTGATNKKKLADGTWTETEKITKIPKMEYVSDARELISEKNTRMENIYADYANRCKALGNKARKAYLEVDVPRADPEMAKKYKAEIQSLKKKLADAKSNAPLERLAQVRAGEMIKAMKRSGDETYLTYSASDWKKEKAKALDRARRDVGAKKEMIEPTEREWEAMQNHAVSPSMLKEVLDNGNLDVIKKLAMPKKDMEFSKATISRIKAYAAAGRTQAEIAEALGVSTTTVSKVLA